MTLGTDLTFLVAVAAGLISFLSPCVLPLVPAYLGQLTAVAVAGIADRAPGRRAGSPSATRSPTWLGFGAVFTLLGVTRDLRRRRARRLPRRCCARSAGSCSSSSA